MNILVTDAFCSANRGDAAILDGILTGLGSRLPEARFTVTSHFPALTRAIHGVDAVHAEDVVEVARVMGEAELVVACGGSYLHELYALNLHPRLATIHLARRLGKPVVLFAQSFGPFTSALGRTAARNAMDDCAWIVARDAESYEEVRRLGVRAPLELGVDAAILGTARAMPRPAPGPVLGVTARGWHFPNGGGAERYEDAMVEALDAWGQLTGGTVWFLSNCTSLGGYRQDDRVAAGRIAARLRGSVVVETREDLHFEEVRGQAAACDFLLGTRMHSLIFATTAGVPAFGVAYEAKTAGWLEQVGLAGAHVPIEAPDGLAERLIDAWHDRRAARAALAARLPALREAAAVQLDQLAAIAHGLHPATSAPRRVARGAGWDQETWRYDVAHRRLRTVADLAGAYGAGPVLDLGASTGLLGRMLGPAWDYTGLDVAPSVATETPGFRIRTTSLDAAWPLPAEARFRTVLASGALEYAEDMGGVLAQAREHLALDGVAILTLLNLGHFARGVGFDDRHPDWRFDVRPDDWLLSLVELGLQPIRVVASSAGWAPPPAVDHETPTDVDRDGRGQPGLARALRLGHHLVAVCRKTEPKPGAAAIQACLDAGDALGAARIAADRVKAFPWAARAWVDLGVIMHLAGHTEDAGRHLLKAAALDPARPEVRENLAALGLRFRPTDAETAVLHDPDDAGAWELLRSQLAARGLAHSAATVGALAQARLRRVA